MLHAGPDLERSRPSAYAGLRPCRWAVWKKGRWKEERNLLSQRLGVWSSWGRKGRRKTCVLALESNQGGKEKGSIFS